MTQWHVDFMDEEEEEDLAERLSVEMLPLHGRDRWRDPIFKLPLSAGGIDNVPTQFTRSELLQASFLQWDFDPAAIRTALDTHFAIRNAKIDILSPVYKGKHSQDESEGDSDEDEDEEDEDDDDGESKRERAPRCVLRYL